MEGSPIWVAYVTALGAILTPILVLGLGALGWVIRARSERRVDLENKLRDDRIQTYNDILEPFIVLFMTDEAWKSDPKHKSQDKNQFAGRTLLSLEYRRKAFKMSLVGSDGVVYAYNDLMQYFFQRGEDAETTEAEVREWMAFLGTFLLQIRRSMGNEATKLNHWQMLEWFITDARRYRTANEAASIEKLAAGAPS